MNKKRLPPLNKNTFELYYKAYSESALRISAAMLRNNAAAADAVQEAFMRVYVNMHKFDGSRKFEPWFYRILINECKRTFSKKDTNNVPIEEITKIAQMPKNEYSELYEAIGLLDVSLRSAIILKYLAGYSEKEVAEILRLNLSTAKSRIKRGKEKLRNIITRGEQL